MLNARGSLRGRSAWRPEGLPANRGALPLVIAVTASVRGFELCRVLLARLLPLITADDQFGHKEFERGTALDRNC